MSTLAAPLHVAGTRSSGAPVRTQNGNVFLWKSARGEYPRWSHALQLMVTFSWIFLVFIIYSTLFPHIHSIKVVNFALEPVWQVLESVNSFYKENNLRIMPVLKPHKNNKSSHLTCGRISLLNESEVNVGLKTVVGINVI